MEQTLDPDHLNVLSVGPISHKSLQLLIAATDFYALF